MAAPHTFISVIKNPMDLPPKGTVALRLDGAGAPVKFPEVEEALYNYFLHQYLELKGRVTSSLLRARAKILLRKVQTEALEAGQKEPPPTSLAKNLSADGWDGVAAATAIIGRRGWDSRPSPRCNVTADGNLPRQSRPRPGAPVLYLSVPAKSPTSP